MTGKAVREPPPWASLILAARWIRKNRGTQKHEKELKLKQRNTLPEDDGGKSYLEKARVEVEDVSGVGLTTGWTTEQEGHLTVGDGLLRKIVEDDQSVLAVVTEVLSHGGTSVWGEVLKWGGIRGGGRHDNGVLEGIGVLETLDELGDSGALLADGDVDAVKLLLLISSVVEALLVDDGVDSDGSLAWKRKKSERTSDGCWRRDRKDRSKEIFADVCLNKQLGLEEGTYRFDDHQ
jgi:hypothetical protein